jgi:isopentenyl diphosphate isomerase/L-lactate dehydrogenase-like FMN-dependent dehydrogenase
MYANSHTGPKVFQLYVWKDRGLVQDVIKKAKAGGFNALALTADFTWYGNRERDVRNGMHFFHIHSLKSTLIMYS